VVLGGDVGGGKSTHAGLLVWYFRQRCGIGARYAHVKSFHALSRALFLLLLLLRYRSRLVLRACRSFSPFRIFYEHDRELLVKTFAVASLLNFLDVAVIALARQRLLGAFTRVFVFEDHVVGYANDVMYFFYALDGRMSKRARAAWLLGLLYLLGLLRGRSAVFFLHAPLNELARRWRERGTPYEYAEYLLAGRAAARLLERMGLKITYVDTSKPLPKVFAKILCSLKEALETYQLSRQARTCCVRERVGSQGEALIR
jgi:hypothetical protein